MAEPCADCPWRLLILRSKPVVLALCERCTRWFVSKNVREFQDSTDVRMLDVVPDGDTKHVNKLLRCDCMAPFILLARLQQCRQCSAIGTLPLQATPSSFFACWLEKLVDMPKDRRRAAYAFSSLPAYTLQRRCGADPKLTELYLRLRPAAKTKVAAYQERRRREQAQFEKRSAESVEE